MRVTAALQGDLRKIMRDELAAATAGVRMGVMRGQQLAKGQLRGAVKRAGLPGLEKTWSDKSRRGKLLFYENEGTNPAALLVNRAPAAIEAHTAGVTIVPRRGRFLAIPTPEAQRLRRGRRKITPETFPGGKGRLRYVPRRTGPHLLVLDRKTKSGRGDKTTVMFWLVPQVRLRRRIEDWRTIAARIEGMLPAIIRHEYEKAERAGT